MSCKQSNFMLYCNQPFHVRSPAVLLVPASLRPETAKHNAGDREQCPCHPRRAGNHTPENISIHADTAWMKAEKTESTRKPRRRHFTEKITKKQEKKVRTCQTAGKYRIKYAIRWRSRLMGGMRCSATRSPVWAAKSAAIMCRPIRH